MKTRIESFAKNKRKAVLSAALVLFLLLAISFPFATGVAFAGGSGSANHTLTYENGQNLYWDPETVVDANGVGLLDFFTAVYGTTTKADDGSNLIAPGTTGRDSIRLHNKDYDNIKYTAVVYRISDKDLVNVTATLKNSGGKRTSNYTLPDGVSGAKVLAAYEGQVSGGKYTDFTIDWKWAFSPSAARDTIDTSLGNGAVTEPKDVLLGFYIVVTDLNDTKAVPKPRTGDNFTIVLYIALMLISIVTFIYVLFLRRRDDEEEETTAYAPINPANLN